MKANDILKKLWSIKARRADPVPKGYKHIDDLCKEWKARRGTVRLWLIQLEKAGKIKKIRLRHFDGRRIQMKYFYGP